MVINEIPDLGDIKKNDWTWNNMLLFSFLSNCFQIKIIFLVKMQQMREKSGDFIVEIEER